MSTDVEVKVILEVTTCNACGIPFAIPDYLIKDFRKNGQIFYCPNGHSLYFGKSEADKLRDQLKTTEQQKALYKNWYEAEQSDHAHTRRRLSATKGELTKTKKRVSNGVCPCCQRHFSNLQRHMNNKHPNYNELSDSEE